MFKAVPLWLKVVVVLVVLAAWVMIYNRWEDSVGDEREAIVNTRWEAATAKLKLEAANKLAAAEARALAAEGKLQAHLTERNLKDATNKSVTQKLRDDLRTDRATTGGRMRDPNQEAGCGRGSGDTAGKVDANTRDRATNSPQAGGLLSTQLTGLLDKLTSESDDINNAYLSCRDDAFKVRGVLPTSQ